MLTSHHIISSIASERVADLRRAAATGSESRTKPARGHRRWLRIAWQRRRIFATARPEGQ
jgi:hypothetical protein